MLWLMCLTPWANTRLRPKGIRRLTCAHQPAVRALLWTVIAVVWMFMGSITWGFVIATLLNIANGSDPSVFECAPPPPPLPPSPP